MTDEQKPDAPEPAPADERDYLREAMGIAAGTARFVAEDKHVIALAAAQAQTVKDLQTLSQILAAFLLAAGPDVDHLPVTAEHMRRVIATRTQIYVKRNPDGSAMVVRHQAGADRRSGERRKPHGRTH